MKITTIVNIIASIWLAVISAVCVASWYATVRFKREAAKLEFEATNLRAEAAYWQGRAEYWENETKALMPSTYQ